MYEIIKILLQNFRYQRFKYKNNCIILKVDKTDSILYCGTASGDILKLQLVLSDGILHTYDGKLLNCLTRMVKKETPGDIGLFSGGKYQFYLLIFLFFIFIKKAFIIHGCFIFLVFFFEKNLRKDQCLMVNDVT